MVAEGSGERVSSRFIMSHTCSIGETSGVHAGQGSCSTPQRAHCVTAAGGRHAEAHHLPIEDMAATCH